MPAAHSDSRVVQFRRIVLVERDPDGNTLAPRTIGYLETHRGVLRGSRREYLFTHILDVRQRVVGLIAEGGDITVRAPNPVTEDDLRADHGQEERGPLTDEDLDRDDSPGRKLRHYLHGGAFYRFTEFGSREYMGTDGLESGLRTFFDLPGQSLVTFEAIDVYGDMGVEPKRPPAPPTEASPAEEP